MTWRCKLAVTSSEVQLLVQSNERGDLLEARIPARARHPRALLTMLEGIALWSEMPPCAAMSADESVQRGCGLGLFGDEPWLNESPLVRFEAAARVTRRALREMGDFCALRRGRRAAERRER